MSAERDRIERFAELARRAHRSGLTALPDDVFLLLLDEYRWGVGRLAAARPVPAGLRGRLNAAVLKAHAALHVLSRRSPGRVGPALRRCAGSLVVTTAVLAGSVLVTLALVLADPSLAYALVPRSVLTEIDVHAWGSRGSLSADVGMTFFYWGNNLRASFLALSLGVLGGLPALLVVARNGAMLGAVAAVALQHDAGWRFLGWLSPHGVPELTALALCGAVGLQWGTSWLAPGWHTRRAALQQAGGDLTPLVVVAAALVLCAAPLEGFVAPRQVPLWAGATIALGWILVLLLMARAALTARSGTRSGA